MSAVCPVTADDIKCVTKVVEDGLNKNNSPEPDSLFPFPILLQIFWKPAALCKSSPVSYDIPLALSSSALYAW